MLESNAWWCHGYLLQSSSLRMFGEIEEPFCLQLLVFQLAFEFLRFSDFPNCLVEVVLIDRFPFVFDGKYTAM